MSREIGIFPILSDVDDHVNGFIIMIDWRTLSDNPFLERYLKSQSPPPVTHFLQQHHTYPNKVMSPNPSK